MVKQYPRFTINHYAKHITCTTATFPAASEPAIKRPTSAGTPRSVPMPVAWWALLGATLVAGEGEWPKCLEAGVAYTNLLDAQVMDHPTVAPLFVSQLCLVRIRFCIGPTVIFIQQISRLFANVPKSFLHLRTLRITT